MSQFAWEVTVQIGERQCAPVHLTIERPVVEFARRALITERLVSETLLGQRSLSIDSVEPFVRARVEEILALAQPSLLGGAESEQAVAAAYLTVLVEDRTVRQIFPAVELISTPRLVRAASSWAETARENRELAAALGLCATTREMGLVPPPPSLFLSEVSRMLIDSPFHREADPEWPLADQSTERVHRSVTAVVRLCGLGYVTMHQGWWVRYLPLPWVSPLTMGLFALYTVWTA